MFGSGPMRVASAGTAALALAAAGLVATPQQASAASRCWGRESAGYCFSVHKTKLHTVVVENVPIKNHSHKTITTSCSFEHTVTRNLTATISVSGSVKANLFKVVEASTTIDLSLSVSLTASRSTRIVGSFKLKPGEGVMCQRTYGYLQATVVESSWSGVKASHHTFTTKVPYTMGAQFVDI